MSVIESFSNGVLDIHDNKVLHRYHTSFNTIKLMIGATLAWLYCESLVNCDLFIKFPLYRKYEWHLQRIGASSLNNASLLHSASYFKKTLAWEFQVWRYKISNFCRRINLFKINSSVLQLSLVRFSMTQNLRTYINKRMKMFDFQ